MTAAAASEKVCLEKPLTLNEIIERERESHRNFFGQEFDLSGFARTLNRYGEGQITLWQRLGLEPHYLPQVLMSPDKDFPGWKIRPGKWLYRQAAEGLIRRRCCYGGAVATDKDVFMLGGTIVLIDTRLKPNYNLGRQMFENDCLLGPVIEKLIGEGKIRRKSVIPFSSRFGISAFDWDYQIKSAFTEYLGLAISQIRLERIIEINVIPQLYLHLLRRDDGKTTTVVWCEEYTDNVAYRIFGGSSEYGGLSYFFHCEEGERWDYRAFRPLIILN